MGKTNTQGKYIISIIAYLYAPVALQLCKKDFDLLATLFEKNPQLQKECPELTELLRRINEGTVYSVNERLPAQVRQIK
jgi:hypothetical protein